MQRLTDADRIAREAARLIETGQVESIGAAIHRAAERLHLSPRNLPGERRVRDHLRAMSLQALGSEGYRDRVLATWRTAEELMGTLEAVLPGCEPRFVGRAARGQIDGGATIYVRAHTRERIGEVARVLVEQGYPEPVFETADTRFGRFDRLRFKADDAEIVVTRCLPQMLWKASVDLFRSTPIECLSIEELSIRIAEAGKGTALPG